MRVHLEEHAIKVIEEAVVLTGGLWLLLLRNGASEMRARRVYRYSG